MGIESTLVTSAYAAAFLFVGYFWYTRDTGYASGFDPRGFDVETRGGYSENNIWVWNPYYVGPRGR